jgi:hypothetical protein
MFFKKIYISLWQLKGEMMTKMYTQIACQFMRSCWSPFPLTKIPPKLREIIEKRWGTDWIPLAWGDKYYDSNE